MRFSEMLRKELICLKEGKKMPGPAEMDLDFDPETGHIQALLVHPGRRLQFQRTKELQIPWTAVKKVGPDMIFYE